MSTESLKLRKQSKLPGAQPTILSASDRMQLMQLMQSGSWPLLLRLMEMKCVLAETEVLEADPADEKAIAAKQHIAVAKWGFFAEIVDQIEFEVNEVVAKQGRPETKSDDELARTLDPVREIEQTTTH